MTIRRISVNFGTGKANLVTVGYTLIGPGNAIASNRITGSIDIYPDGQYAFDAAIPDGFQGDCVVDTGDSNPKTLIVSINPDQLPTRSDLDLQVSSATQTNLNLIVD